MNDSVRNKKKHQRLILVFVVLNQIFRDEILLESLYPVGEKLDCILHDDAIAQSWER